MTHLPVEVLLKLADESYQQHTIKVAEVECLITIVDGIQVVSVRGTEGGALISGNGWLDVLRDIRIVPWYNRHTGWSHAGFLKGAKGIVDRGLFGALRRSLPVVLTGHSMGGAIALNAAMLLKGAGFNVSLVVTFGAPRTFKKGAAKKFTKSGISCYQYAMENDPVTKVPFRWWRYRHVNEIKIGQGFGLSAFESHLLKSYSRHLAGGYGSANN